MKVVTAGAGHCLSHDIVEVSIGDLQDMLNTFNQRLEENIHKLNACVTAKAGCVRS
jgi:5'-deoxynucleotidase YfbR-like HD superfamily hydrolase